MLTSLQIHRQAYPVCSLILTFCLVHSPVLSQTAGFLHVVPTEGEGAFNAMRTGYVHPPVVRVTDETGKAVVGAEVIFSFPAVGAGAILPGGGQSLKAETDAAGLARCPTYKPNTEEGRFRIKVTANYQGKTGTFVINQSNTRAGSTPAGEQKSSKKYWIWALVAGGAAAGIVVATTGSSSSSSPTVPPTTLSAGAITVGGPR